MDYFDFEQAAVPTFDLDDQGDLSFLNEDPVSTSELNQFDQLFLDAPVDLSHNVRSSALPLKLKLVNNREVEVVPHTDDTHLGFPMFRAKVPCNLCARQGLDCYLASRGALVTGCTACISLYRECSFTHDQMPKGYVSTFPGITEDVQVCHGPVTERKRAMVSMEESRRKTGARFPRDAIKILKRWVAEHRDHPYPNEREKDELKQLTGLKRSQISNWLANARRRGKVHPASGPSSPMLGAIDIPKASRGKDMAELDPLDRWKISPPENEPASMTAIARAITTNPVVARHSSHSSLQNSRTNSHKASSEEDSTNFSMFRAPSVSSFETKDSSNSDLSFASSRSHRSRGSLASSQDRRRRRRAPMTQRVAAQQQSKSRAARIFQCTFCTETFPAKYDWQRHEKSLHLALERWTCCPHGGTRTDALTGHARCVFCPELNPSAEHLDGHNYLACREKTTQERTFYRKDHLRQHLRLMHATKFDPHMDAWKSTTNEIGSRCGFCPSRFATWTQRVEHLAAHFRNGADMAHWGGNWGLEPSVEKLVENAIPPYLIGLERSTMNPYVARAAVRDEKTPTSTGPDSGLTFGSSADDDDSVGRCEPDQISKDSNCWHRVEEELIKFVGEQKNLGLHPSDSCLQDHARTVIYGDVDPLDWTVADNQTWLDAFKFQHGLGPAPAQSEFHETSTVPVHAPYVVKGGLGPKRIQEAACPTNAGRNHGRHTSLDASGISPIPERACPKQFGGPAHDHDHDATFVTTHAADLDLDQDVVDTGRFTGPGEASVDVDMDLDFDGIDFDALELDGFGESRPDRVEHPPSARTDLAFFDVASSTPGSGPPPGLEWPPTEEATTMTTTSLDRLEMSRDDLEQLSRYMVAFE